MTYPIENIEGIGPVKARTLQGVGIWTTDDLLRAGGDPSGRKALSEMTMISDSTILEWANRADLMRVAGVGEEYSDLLENSGVDTVKELATRDPENLAAKMEEVNKKKKLVRRTPAASVVKKWIEEAKKLDPILTY